MKKQALLILTLSSINLLSADSYPYSSCPGGNCQYPGSYGQHYQSQDQYPGRTYYQGSGQSQYQDQRYDRPYYEGQGQKQPYYHNQSNRPYSNDQYSDRSYYQGSESRQPYSQDSKNYQQSNRYENDMSRSQSMNRDDDGYYNSSSRSNNSSDYDDSNRSDDRYNSSNSNSNSNYNNSNRSNGNQTRFSDEDLSRQIHDTIGSGWLSSGYPNVTFDVNNGTVNLRGSVKTQDEKIKLENAVRKIEGIKRINNEVSVDEARSASQNRNKQGQMANRNSGMQTDTKYPQDSAMTDSDKVINSKIRSKLSGWFTDGFETMTLTTANGVVTISGFVEKDEDINKINKDVKAVDGVKSVNNNVNSKKKESY